MCHFFAACCLQVEDAIVAAAVEEGLVTPHTSAVGVLLQVRQWW